MTTRWTTEMFDQFAAAWMDAKPLQGRERARLRGYAQFFIDLGQHFPTREMVTATRLAEKFPVEQLRRRWVPYKWLVENGHLPALTPHETTARVHAARQARLLARVSERWKLDLLTRYLRHLHGMQVAWRKRGWADEYERLQDASVTLLLRAAFRFLGWLPAEVQTVQGIDCGQLERFVVELPGHRNALHSFIDYLNRKEPLFQRLHIDRSMEKHSIPHKDLLTEDRVAELLARWLPPHPGVTRRNALLGLLILVYARRARQACELKRGTLSIHRDGTVSARFGRVAVELEPRIASMVVSQMAEVEAQLGRKLTEDDYIFPGRLPGRCYSPASLQYVLATQGVSANQLYTSAIAEFYRAGLKTPKVLVKTLGISDLTAIDYWRAFQPQSNEELEYLAGRR